MLKIKFISSIFAVFVSIIGVSSMADTDLCHIPPVPSISTLKRLAATTQPDRGVLWKVSKGNKSSYLYGTIHVAKLEWDFPGPTILSALNQSIHLAVEVDTTDPTFLQRFSDQGNALAAQMALQLASAEGQDLQARVSRFFKVSCINEAQFGGTSIGSKITTLELMSANDQLISPTFSIDTSLIGFSKAMHKSVIELETVQEQAIALNIDFDSMMNDISMLESGETRKQIIRLATAWEEGDIQELEKYPAWCGCTKDKKTLDRLFSQRNETLSKRMDNIFQAQDGVFAAIGILHMIGSTGVVERLKEMGYSVQQLPNKKN